MTSGAARFGAAALAAGLVAAVAIPGHRVGLGVVLAVLAVAAAARIGIAAAPRGARDRLWSVLWAALALLLVCSAILRDAGWVVAPALLGSLFLGSLAVAGGRTWLGVLGGVVAAPWRAPFGAVAVAQAAAASLPAGSGGHVRPALRGAALGVALLSVFGLLFASADSAFADIASDALRGATDVGPLPARIAVFAVAFALVCGLVLAHRTTAGAGALPVPGRRLGAVEWTIALVTLDALFAVFVGVQAAVLFGKDDHVLRTAGLTYAEYAREGFGQLLVAAALTLGVVAAALRWSDAATPPRRRLLRALLAVLCALTLVVLASALHRLGLYEDAFGATRLRFAANATLLWLGALLALLLAALAANREAWLPRAAVLASAVALTGFVLADPDRRIAERNVARYEKTGDIDVWYLRGLSADAAPALDRLPGRPRTIALSRLRDRLDAADGLAGWNRARSRARDVLS